MNQKKAKQLRQDMRDMGFDPAEVSYQHTQAPVYVKAGFNEKGETVFKEDGDQIIKVQKGIPKELGKCGRKLYQEMKSLS